MKSSQNKNLIKPKYILLYMINILNVELLFQLPTFIFPDLYAVSWLFPSWY